MEEQPWKEITNVREATYYVDGLLLFNLMAFRDLCRKHGESEAEIQRRMQALLAEPLDMFRLYPATTSDLDGG